jgi:hypothetical protein
MPKRLELASEEAEFVRMVLQNHIWDTSSTKQGIMAQAIIDRIDEPRTEPRGIHIPGIFSKGNFVKA